MPEGGLEPFAQWTRVVAEEAPGFAVVTHIGDTCDDAQTFGCVGLREECVEGFDENGEGFEHLVADRPRGRFARQMAG